MPTKTTRKKTFAEGGGVLIMGLPRSGTYSVAHAMKMLGYDRVFHNLDVATDDNETWGAWLRALWACKPYLREHVGLPYFAKKNPPPDSFTRKDWDELLGNNFQVIADMTVYFVAELIETYPDAKVILWQRDMEKWKKSYDNGVLRGFDYHNPWDDFKRKHVISWSNVYWHTTMWYGVAGWLRAKEYDNMVANLEDRYKEHFEMVRKMVKPGNLLEYRLGDGWEDVCEFLDCEVPEEPFPHINDAAAINKLGTDMNSYVMRLAVWNMFKYPLLVGAGALAVGWGYMNKMDGRALFSISS